MKENSITSPSQVVFDGLQPTDSSYNLKDLVPKGINMLNKLVEIFIRWQVFPEAFHCDIQKIYSVIRLSEEYWWCQRYLFQKDLDSKVPPEEKIIKTMIYDIRSSGNQAQCALRKVAEIFKDKYSDVHQIILKLMYMNDCMVGDKDKEEPNKRQDDLQMVLGCGGFNLKGFTVSGKDPDELLTSDGVSVSVAGQRWFSSGRSHIVGYE